MDRGHLQQIIEGNGEVDALCRQALEEGAPFNVWDDEVPTSKLQNIYVSRERRARRVGQDSIGFSHAIESLFSHQGESLKLGFVDNRQAGGYYFQIFLSSDCEQVVACLGVRKAEESPEL